MDKRNISNLGEDILNIVDDAIRTGNFRQLSRDIGGTVNGALDEARNSIKWTHDNRRRINRHSNPFQGQNYTGNYNNTDDNSNAGYNGNTGYNSNTGNNSNKSYTNTNYNNNASNNNTTGYKNYSNYANSAKNKYYDNANSKQANSVNNQVINRYKNTPKVIKNTVSVGKVSGILCTVFGNIGVILLGIAIVVLMVVGHLLGRDEFFATIILGISPFMILSIIILARGNYLRKRIKRMQQYVTLLGGRNYSLIKDLSASTGLSVKFLAKDLQKMISLGMFPEAHLDDKRTCFMLDNESYKLYLNLQENMQQVKIMEQQKQAEQKKEEVKKQEAAKNTSGLDKEARAAIEEGRRYINKIREANYAIPGEEVSSKLDHLEDVICKIFDYVEIHPEQLPEIRKFMEYYLPTTIKLVDAYKEFDRQPVQGENITTAKNEIEKTLDTINLAFENLLDDLFEDVAMDVSTDISVLNTMLAQEGLTEKNFKSLSK